MRRLCQQGASTQPGRHVAVLVPAERLSEAFPASQSPVALRLLLCWTLCSTSSIIAPSAASRTVEW